MDEDLGQGLRRRVEGLHRMKAWHGEGIASHGVAFHFLRRTYRCSLPQVLQAFRHGEGAYPPTRSAGWVASVCPRSEVFNLQAPSTWSPGN